MYLKNDTIDQGQYATGTCDDQKLNSLLVDAVARLDADEAVDLDELITNHPEYAEEIKSFFPFCPHASHVIDAAGSMDGESTVLLREQHATTSYDDDTIPIILNLARDDDPDPSRIGKYEIRQHLADGTFGRVYLGFDPLAQRLVAIKVPKSTTEVFDEHHRGFLHEAEVTASLRHDNIVGLYEVFQSDTGEVALVYEYVSGPSLLQVLKEGDYQREEAVQWIAAVADALHYAHRENIVHRDIKPSNILLEESEGQLRPKLIDFGLALFHGQSWRDSEDYCVGSVGYMSPEQARGESHCATARSDIFSMAVILYEVLCRHSPWKGGSKKIKLREIQDRQPTPLRVLDDSIPQTLERICLKAMAKLPEDRYTTAADLAQDLRAATSPKTTLRWRSLVAAAAIAVAFAAVGAKMFC